MRPRRNHEAMDADELYIEIDDLGAPPPLLLERDAAWEAADTPLGLDLPDVHDLWKGVALPAYGARSLVVEGLRSYSASASGRNRPSEQWTRSTPCSQTLRVEPVDPA
jgi:hypothetical protein